MFITNVFVYILWDVGLYIILSLTSKNERSVIFLDLNVVSVPLNCSNIYTRPL